MIEEIAYIRERVKLHNSSTIACATRMVLSAYLIPFYLRLFICGLEALELPIQLGWWQYLIYGVAIALYWYICRIRMWSHSYMIDYIHTALDNGGSYCPRCFSRMKGASETYFYDEKIGETTHTTYYSDGWSTSYTEDICIQRSEELPVLLCQNWACGLQTRARTENAQSSEVRSQIKEYYSYYEMPRTFKNTFRLIAGDLDDDYNRSILCAFHGKSHHIILIAISVIIGIFSAMAQFNTFFYVNSLLFGSAANVIAYIVLIAILLTGYFAIQAYIKKKCAEVYADQEYTKKVQDLDVQFHGVYLAKRQSYDLLKKRRKALKKARKDNDPSVKDLKEYDYRGETKLVTDQISYASKATDAVCAFLPDMGFAYTLEHINSCYIVKATTEDHPRREYKLYFNCENGCAIYSLAVLQGFPHSFREQVLEHWTKEHEDQLNGFYFYYCEDKVVIGFTVPPTLTYEFTDEEIEVLKWRFEQFYSLMKTFVSENMP